MDIQDREQAIRKYMACRNALLSTTEAAQALCEIGVQFSESRLRAAREDGPAFLKIGRRLVRYRVRDLLEWAGLTEPA